MFPIFDYNSRSFTLLAIALLIVLGYSSFKSSEPINTASLDGASGARYVLELDPHAPDQSFFEKAVLYIFKDDIDKKQHAPAAPTFASPPQNIQTAGMGDSVTIIYYKTTPMPSYIPMSEDVVIGSNKLPKVVDGMLVGMKIGEKREFKAGEMSYHIELLDIRKPAGGE